MAKKKKLKNKKRITRVVILAIIVILAVAVAYKVYAYFFLPESNAPIEVNNDPVKYNIVGSKPLNISPREIDRTNKLPIDAEDGKVGIPELGIKFRLSEGLKGLVYYPKDINNDQFVTFSTATLSNLDMSCVASEGPLGYFARIEKSELSKGNPSGNWRSNEAELKKISKEWVDGPSGQTMSPMTKEFDKFYILFEGPQATCSADKFIQNLQSSQSRLLQGVIPSIELL